MKTLKISGMGFLLALVSTASLLAQPGTVKIAEKQQLSPSQTPYYERPHSPDSYAELRRKKSGRSEQYLNMKKLPTTLLLGLMNNSAADEAESKEKAERKTFDISLYRVQESTTVCLSMEKLAGQKVSIRLLNHKGEELHVETVGRLTKMYACRFDLSKVKDGTYTIEVRNGEEVIHKSLRLTTDAPVPTTPARTLVAVNEN